MIFMMSILFILFITFIAHAFDFITSLVAIPKAGMYIYLLWKQQVLYMCMCKAETAKYEGKINV